MSARLLAAGAVLSVMNFVCDDARPRDMRPQYAPLVFRTFMRG